MSGQWSGDEAALLALLRTRTFKRGEFTLVSGKRSRIYFNMKATMMHPQGASLCARLLLAKIAPLKPDYMGGLEMGAVPLLGTVAAYSADCGPADPCDLRPQGRQGARHVTDDRRAR